MDQVVSAMLGLTLALVLSLVVGLEREYFAKSAGVRTYTLVGMGSALFTVVSKYGFMDTPLGGAPTDGSRIAAQVVSGIGFLGAGVIFVRRESVRGLTTAAGIWFVAAIGMAAAAGMFIVAPFATAIYLLIAIGFRKIAHDMPRAASASGLFTVLYDDGHGVLRVIMEAVAQRGLKVVDLEVGRVSGADGARVQEVTFDLQGNGAAMAALAEELVEVPGVRSVERSRHLD